MKEAVSRSPASTRVLGQTRKKMEKLKALGKGLHLYTGSNKTTMKSRTTEKMGHPRQIQAMIREPGRSGEKVRVTVIAMTKDLMRMMILSRQKKVLEVGATARMQRLLPIRTLLHIASPIRATLDT